MTFKTTLLALLACGLQAQTITINWGTTLQTIDGFGAAAVDNVGTLTSAEMDFFYTQSGIGLSLVRTQIEPDQTSCLAWVGGSTGCVSSSGATLGTAELASVQQAVARGAKVVASIWSPPAAMKSNDAFASGGSLIGNSTNYTTLAADVASFVTLLTGTYGLPVAAIDVQNEPDISQTYPSCTWTAQQIHDYIPYLSAALTTAGYSTPIMMPEASGWSFSLGTTAMSDSSVASDVSIVAGHAYSGTPGSTGLSNITTQHIWMTEYGSAGSSYTGTMADALAYATLLHDYLTEASISAWLNWFISDEPCCGNGTDNSALTDDAGNIPLRTYALGNWSKFVRPGWHMVGVSNSGSLLVTAFENANATQWAIVVVNTSSSAVSSQVFSIGSVSGVTATPWITSATQALAQQASIPVSGGSFTYTIPASSVVTFQGPGSPTAIAPRAFRRPR